MPNSFNVLITSLSQKVPLIREVRKALMKIDPNGQIIGADSNPACVGRYFVDDFWNMPPMDNLKLEDVIHYCKTNDIRSIIPTRDGELLFFADNRQRFNDHAIAVMIASPDSGRTCLDKNEFFKTLTNIDGLNPIPTFDLPEPNCEKRWVVKERFGAGSRNIMLDVSTDEARLSLGRFEEPICQHFVEGREHSIDLYIAQNSTPKGCIVRTRDVVVNGESQVTTTADRPEIEQKCLEAVAAIGLTGHVLFQIIEDSSGLLNFLECNCRFGGASSLSVAAGLDSFYWFFVESLGDDLSDIPYLKSRHGLRQIRYAEDKVVLLD